MLPQLMLGLRPKNGGGCWLSPSTSRWTLNRRSAIFVGVKGNSGNVRPSTSGRLAIFSLQAGDKAHCSLSDASRRLSSGTSLL